MLPGVLNMIAGLWLMISPSLLEYSSKDSNNVYVTGVIVISMAIISTTESLRNIRWVNFLAGLWLLSSIWMFGMVNRSEMLNNTLMGIVIVLFSLLKGKIKNEYGGGWGSLFKK